MWRDEHRKRVHETGLFYDAVVLYSASVINFRSRLRSWQDRGQLSEAPLNIYSCGLHGLPLTSDGKSARCPRCTDLYPIEENIWILDTVHRPDRLAFDQHVEVSPIPLDLSKAERHLKVAGVGMLRNATILDVGCGLGDMTYSLSCHPQVAHSDIYAFDHSIASLREAARNVAQTAKGNRVHFSTQDASCLFFPAGSFDLVVGNAVLHHITDYPAFLKEVFRILKPGGKAVFSEPFLSGTFWPCFFLYLASNELGLPSLIGPEYGMADFILKDTTYRLQNAGNFSALDKLSDKHYFREDTLSTLAYDMGYTNVRFENVEGAAFYDGWMAHFLDVYQVHQESLRQKAIEVYAQLRDYAGTGLPEIVPHFRHIVLQR